MADPAALWMLATCCNFMVLLPLSAPHPAVPASCPPLLDDLISLLRARLYHWCSSAATADRHTDSWRHMRTYTFWHGESCFRESHHSGHMVPARCLRSFSFVCMWPSQKAGTSSCYMEQ